MSEETEDNNKTNTPTGNAADAAPIFAINYTYGRSYMPAHLAISPGISAEKAAEIESFLRDEIGITVSSARKTISDQYIKEKDTPTPIEGVHDAIRINIVEYTEKTGEEPSVLIQRLADKGFLSKDVLYDYEQRTAEEEKSYRADFNPFAILENTFLQPLYTRVFKNFSVPLSKMPDFVQQPIASYRRALNHSTISTIGKNYIVGDLEGYGVSALNRDWGDFGFASFAIASSGAMGALGSLEDGLTANERFDNKTIIQLNETNPELAQRTGQALDKDEIWQLKRKEKWEEVGDVAGMAGNALSSLPLMRASIRQRNPIKFTQSIIIGSMFALSTAAKYLAEPMDSFLRSVPWPDNIKNNVPDGLVTFWNKTLDDYHFPITYVKNHNILGIGTGLYDIARSPKISNAIEAEYNADLRPEFAHVKTVRNPDGSYEVVRSGHWKHLPDHVRNDLVRYASDGFVGVDAEGKLHALPQEYVQSARIWHKQGEQQRVTIDGVACQICPVPYAFQYDPATHRMDDKTGAIFRTDPVTGVRELATEPPASALKFQAAMDDHRMFHDQLRYSGPLNIKMVLTYLQANGSFGSVKNDAPAPDLNEYYSKIAMRLLRPMEGTQEEQAEARAAFIKFAAQDIHDVITEQNDKVRASNARWAKSHPDDAAKQKPLWMAQEIEDAGPEHHAKQIAETVQALVNSPLQGIIATEVQRETAKANARTQETQVASTLTEDKTAAEALYQDLKTRAKSIAEAGNSIDFAPAAA